MKRAIKILALSVLLSTLLFYATANDSSDDSKFLMIDRSIDDTPVGEWVQPNKDSGQTASRASAPTTTHDQADYVIRPSDAYSKIDISTYTTEDLVVLLLNNHRSIASMLHFSRSSDPYEEAKTYFYGLAELENRPDAVNVLLRALSALESAVPSSEQETTVFRMRIRFLSAVLESPYYKQVIDSE
jgi:hypothetical protein